ncbi:BESS domain-containing protein [Meloidogyne graminicola]|uniref:BESS domain-containing protein n=2 Tax=Meloidogyne graminicola TaxID=189291 RepID=A0A8S9ZMY8_9BILA|nr:BESS domain-containing protein [Meloidogyne graminicola]
MQSPDISTNKGAVHSPDKKKVKFDTLSDSSSGENELNASKKSDIVFDESGSLNDSDMEDESDFEDFEDEEDLDSLMDEEDDSLMEDEDDSLSLDEVKNGKKDAFLASKGVKTFADSKKEETTKKEISKKVELANKPVETKKVGEKPVEAKPAEENKMEEVGHDGYMFYCRSLAEFMRALPKKKEVEFRMEVEKLKLNFID